MKGPSPPSSPPAFAIIAGTIIAGTAASITIERFVSLSSYL